MRAARRGRTMVEILADVLGDYQERCAEYKRINEMLISEMVRLRELVKELGGDQDGER